MTGAEADQSAVTEPTAENETTAETKQPAENEKPTETGQSTETEQSTKTEQSTETEQSTKTEPTETKHPVQTNGAAAAQEALEDGEPTQLELDIIRQIEYYFGDINLPRDKFLQEQLKLEDGWVPLDVLTKFHRLSKLSSDTVVISAAVGKSTSGLLQVSEDGKKVRRDPEQTLPELNEERRKELTTRTVYVKGFPLDANVDVCLKFFKDYPVIENVQMRRYRDRTNKKWNFKGSVFATFKTKEQAEEFLKAENLKCGETELITKWQEVYLKDKQDEYKSRKAKKNNNQKEKKEEKHEGIKLPAGAVLHFSGVEDGVSREQIKEALTSSGAEVAFIDFNKGDKEGWVRLQVENTAQPFFEKLTDGKLKVEESVTTFRVLSGEEETTFLDKTTREMVNRRKNANKNKHQHKGRYGRQGGGRKRKQDAPGDGPAQKVKVTE